MANITRRSLLSIAAGIAPIALTNRAWSSDTTRINLHRTAENVTLKPGQSFRANGLKGTGGERFTIIRSAAAVNVAISNPASSDANIRLSGIDGPPIGAATWQTSSRIASGSEAVIPLAAGRPGTFVISSLPVSSTSDVERPYAVIISEPGQAVADRDIPLIIEHWGETEKTVTLNGELVQTIAAKPHERLRLRFINASQAHAIAVILRNESGLYPAHLIAIDGAPAEPFPIKDGRVILPPLGSADLIFDAQASLQQATDILLHDGRAEQNVGHITISGPPMRAAPLPQPQALTGYSLPDKLPLGSAHRAEIKLHALNWPTLAETSEKQPSDFKIARGRTVVLTLANQGDAARVFRLPGHHFRLLDRLDDGWKPFWLQNLIIAKGQTQRIAFLAEFKGRWPMETTILGSLAGQIGNFDVT